MYKVSEEVKCCMGIDIQCSGIFGGNLNRPGSGMDLAIGQICYADFGA